MVSQRGDFNVISQMLHLLRTWADHYRESGQTHQANQIAVALLEPLSRFRQLDDMQSLMDEAHSTGSLSDEQELELDYWRGFLLLNRDNYDEAMAHMEAFDDKNQKEEVFAKNQTSILTLLSYKAIFIAR